MSFHYTISTNKTVDQAIEAIENKLQQIKFGVLWKMSITDTLHSKGFTKNTSPYQILKVSNPAKAEEVLLQNPQAHYFLPCKITVFEKERTTQVGLVKPTELMKPLDDAQLMEILEDIETEVITVLDQI